MLLHHIWIFVVKSTCEMSNLCGQENWVSTHERYSCESVQILRQKRSRPEGRNNCVIQFSSLEWLLNLSKYFYRFHKDFMNCKFKWNVVEIGVWMGSYTIKFYEVLILDPFPSSDDPYSNGRGSSWNRCLPLESIIWKCITLKDIIRETRLFPIKLISHLNMDMAK